MDPSFAEDKIVPIIGLCIRIISINRKIYSQNIGIKIGKQPNCPALDEWIKKLLYNINSTINQKVF